MPYSQRGRWIFHLLAFALSAVLAWPAMADTLVLSQLSDRPKKDFKQLRPMAKYVATQLAPLGITRAEVRLFSDLDELVQAVKAGEVHWVTETPYTASVLVQEAGAVPIAMKWKSRQKRYQTLIYTHKDSNLRSLDDLVGQTIAFEHNNSFSSYYLPRLTLEQQGFTLQEQASLNSPKAPDQVNFLFSRNEKNNLLWVHKRLVDAGALNDGDWNNPGRVPDALKSELRVLYRTKEYPRALELVSPTLSPERAEALRSLLLTMTPRSHGKLLSRYEKTSGFEKITPEITGLLNGIYSSSRHWPQ